MTASAALTAAEAEYYRTPAWCVRRFLEAVQLPWGTHWVEPCVGDGAIVRVVDAHHTVLDKPQPQWSLWDLRPDTCAGASVRDATAPWPHGTFEVGLTNPPFSQALLIVQRMLEHCFHVAILQRLNWLASEARSGWLRKHRPGVYVLPNRPSFTGDGKTDGQEYAWYLWPPQHDGVVVLQSTPRDERKADERTV